MHNEIYIIFNADYQLERDYGGDDGDDWGSLPNIRDVLPDAILSYAFSEGEAKNFIRRLEEQHRIKLEEAQKLISKRGDPPQRPEGDPKSLPKEKKRLVLQLHRLKNISFEKVEAAYRKNAQENNLKRIEATEAKLAKVNKLISDHELYAILQANYNEHDRHNRFIQSSAPSYGYIKLEKLAIPAIAAH